MRTERILCLPAWECAPVAHGSSPCGVGGEGGSVQGQSGARRTRRDDSRFGRVHRSRRVADVLRALEHPESQTVEEVSGRQQAGNRAELETGLLWVEQKHTLSFVWRLFPFQTSSKGLRPDQICGSGGASTACVTQTKVYGGKSCLWRPLNLRIG